MKTAFDRWLAKPSTFRYLRHLIDPGSRPTQPRGCLTSNRHRHCAKRGVATASAAATLKEGDDGEEIQSKKMVLNARKATQAPKSHYYVPEIASGMSLHAGEPLLATIINERGIFSSIQHQSDVNNPQLMGTLIVDEVEQKNKVGLWVEIVRFRRRIDGFEGVLDVWFGMRKRNCDIPASGPESEVLWTEFVQATLCSSDDQTPPKVRLANDIFDHAKELRARTGAACEGLYGAIVGAWLPFRPKHALEWHYKLTKSGFAHPGAIASVGPLAMRTRPWNNVFQQIYEQSTERDLYDSCMAEVFKRGNENLALAWHRFFLRYGDRPSDEMSTKPEVQRLLAMRTGGPTSPKLSSYSQPSSFDPQTQPRMLPISRSSMNTIVGDVHGIKAKEISDGFCARMLATSAISLQIVLNGLTFLGVQIIGPLALRQLARRAGSPAEFIDIKQDLETRGIKVVESTFSQVVSKVAKIGNPVLWTALLETDLHPDTYSDHALQERLLSEFLAKEQWGDVHLALITISIIDPSKQHIAWNRILQHYATTGQHDALLNTMQTVQHQKLPLTGPTLRDLYWSVLPSRQPGKSYVKTEGSAAFDALSFVTNAFMYAAERGSPQRGSYVHDQMWIELLKRHGMEIRWHDLRKAILWLVDWYSKDNTLLQVTRDRKRLEGRIALPHPLDIPRLVLNQYMVKAIFVWGFRYASRRRRLRQLTYGTRSDETAVVDHKQVELWASGLELLRVLWERGLPINKEDVEDAFILRMWMLFGPGSSKVGMNSEARRLNELSLGHYIRHANEVWPGIIRIADAHLLEKSTENRAELLVLLFGHARMTNKTKREFADVEAWAAEIGANGNDSVEEPYGTHAKQALWKYSKFRHKLPEVSITAPNAAQNGRPITVNLQAGHSKNAHETCQPEYAYQPIV